MMALLTDWISQHTVLLGTAAASSVFLLLLSIVAMPWLVAQLPADYLLQRDRRSSRSAFDTPIFKLIGTTIGLVLILLGLVMLVLPGPGIITLLAGISLASFPGKRKLLRHIASRDAVFNSLNWMRTRYGKPPLLHPFHDNP